MNQLTKIIDHKYLNCFKEACAIVGLEYTIIQELPEGYKMSIGYSEAFELAYFGEHFGMLKQAAITKKVLG